MGRHGSRCVRDRLLGDAGADPNTPVAIGERHATPTNGLFAAADSAEPGAAPVPHIYRGDISRDAGPSLSSSGEVARPSLPRQPSKRSWQGFRPDGQEYTVATFGRLSKIASVTASWCSSTRPAMDRPALGPADSWRRQEYRRRSAGGTRQGEGFGVIVPAWVAVPEDEDGTIRNRSAYREKIRASGLNFEAIAADADAGCLTTNLERYATTGPARWCGKGRSSSADPRFAAGLEGELTEEQFKPLRLTPRLYLLQSTLLYATHRHPLRPRHRAS